MKTNQKLATANTQRGQGFSLLNVVLILILLFATNTEAKSDRLSKALNKENKQHQDKMDKLRQKQKDKLNVLDVYPQVLESEVPAVTPIVGQESTYEGYEKLRDPFTSTDEYSFVDAFFGGLKLDDFFDYSDECLNAFIFTVDDAYFFDNNVTLVTKNETETAWHMYLNFTHLLAGQASEIPVDCHLFMISVYGRETNRWQRFEKDWGEFFISLLFNLMGNALNFQQRFANIEQNEENQDFVGVYREYGYLIHLIYDFEPLPEAAMKDVKSFVGDFIDESLPHLSEKDASLLADWMTETTNMIRAHSQKVSGYISDAASSVADAAASVHSGVNSNVIAPAAAIINSILPKNQEPEPSFDESDSPMAQIDGTMDRNETQGPLVGAFPATLTADDGAQIVFGFFEGVFNVFPYESLPNYCRLNITQTWWDVKRMWLNPQWDLALVEDQKRLMISIQQFIQAPYYVSFNCWYGASQVFLAKDPWADGVLTEEERLRTSIIIVHDVLTNVIFNLGYMYKDIFNIATIPADTKDFWAKFGSYFGEFLIRIFWRKDFLSTFVY